MRHIIGIAVMCAGVLVCAACIGQYDPEHALHIEYESPLGCDEVAGIITFRATVKGDRAPVPAGMRYELRLEKDGEPVVLIGDAPDYEAAFDTRTMRDGLVYYTAVPLDDHGQQIDITSACYGARYRPPQFRGIMINNGTLDMTRPFIVFGAESEPYSGELNGMWTAEQLEPHMIFAATLMSHLQEVGYIPGMCFADRRTIVFDPADPLAEDVPASDLLFDMLGEPVQGTPRWNRGTPCLREPFFEIRQPSGFPDIWEHTALDNVKAYTRYGAVTNERDAFGLYDAIAQRLMPAYGAMFGQQSYFAFLSPVRGAEPENLLKRKLRNAVIDGATCVLIYDFYVKTNDFEMSVGSWPNYQKTVDELNTELGTSVGVGTITSNASQLMHYDNFLRSLFLGVRDTVKTSNIPPDKKLGIILVEHGIGRTGRLYDVLRISTPVFNERLTDYFSTRMGVLYDESADIAISYIAGTTSPADNVATVGEQVAEWVAQGYEYIVIYAAEWFWESRQTYLDLRQSAVEEIDKNNSEIYTRDEQERTEIMFEGTRIIVSETTMSKQHTCPAAPHYLMAAGAQHLEDRLIAMTGALDSVELSGTLNVTGGVDLQQAFSDRLLVHDGIIALQHAGLRTRATVTGMRLTGTFDAGEAECFLFALLAESAFGVDQVSVTESAFELNGAGDVWGGWIRIEGRAVIDADVRDIRADIEL